MSIDPLHRDIVSQVNDRLRLSRQKLDDWANRQTALLQRTVEEHTRHVQKDKGIAGKVLQYCMRRSCQIDSPLPLAAENIQTRQVNTAQLKWQSSENQRSMNHAYRLPFRLLFYELLGCWPGSNVSEQLNSSSASRGKVLPSDTLRRRTWLVLLHWRCFQVASPFIVFRRAMRFV
jgi:hypothetical protein